MSHQDDYDWLLQQEIPHLRRYAGALTNNPAEADDLVQDCLERALRKRRLWQRQGRLRSWLFRMLYRIYLNQRRGRRASAVHVPLTQLGVAAAQPARDGQRLECRDTVVAMAELPDDQRVAILLLALEDLSYEEAAWVLRIPVGTLRSRISRGRQRLRELCEHEQPDNGREPERGTAVLRRVK